MKKIVRTISTLVAALLVASLFAVLPAGASTRVRGHQDCPEGTVSVKLDKEPAVGDTVSVAGTTVTITDVRTKDDGSEVVAFQYSAEGGTVRYVIVKGGRDTIRYPGTGFDGAPEWFFAPTIENRDVPRPHHGVSYAQFCILDGS